MSVSPSHLPGKADALEPAGTYRRRMPVSLERMLENALDWEHLPWLHSSSFRSIKLESHDRWHWRARAQMVGIENPTQLELRLHSDRMGWTTRTIDGPGTGTTIDTRVVLHGERDLEVVVKFFIAERVGIREKIEIGKSYIELYEHLYDEDESMMTTRQRRFDGLPPAADSCDLGPADSLDARLPLVVNTSRGRFRVLEHAGRLLVHSAVCPHRLGPLEDCALKGSPGAPEVACPWHGYRFDVATGLSSEGRRYRLAPAPQVRTGDNGRVRLVWPAGD